MKNVLSIVALMILMTAVPVAGQDPVPAPTPAEVEAFVAAAEEELLELWIRKERAAWVQENFINLDTENIASLAYEELMARTAALAKDATRFTGLELSYDLARKLNMIKLSLPLAAPADPSKQSELAGIAASLTSMYSTGKYCPQGDGDCKTLGDLSRTMAASRDTTELLEAWTGWRSISPPMRGKYARFAELGNAGAQELGMADLGAMWRAMYDMPPEAFAAELDRLWKQVKPLYEALHCHVRAELAEEYGSDLVKPGEPIPAHLLGNMWAQSWLNIYDLVMDPEDAGADVDVTRILRDKGVTEIDMVKYGEAFFTSLGFEPLPASFWERSLFSKPEDREVVCHASAWDIDWEDDLRIKMCIEINEEDFTTVHHELGHNFYQRAYNIQDPLYRNSAHDGFHEGIGDTVALSITPEYLVKVGLLDALPQEAGDRGRLMRHALEKIAFLPFGMVVDQWRWQVFSGATPPAEFNAAWWELREKYQGVKPPVVRTEADFDPGAKYHVPANTPYARYFMAQILQFQFHRALCQAAEFEGDLHQCSIYANDAAGKKLRDMLAMGASRAWPEALYAVAGTTKMDGGALLDYFAPLHEWLNEQNKDRTCGW
ncbi:MAG: M2 family metallopeptidase [Acidobacteria bacterium]|uniref:M2 family metallopeptidase n=1 Tax=Candidatus Polarisedimenticola svalbardensis TaxID=2886004 RepID=A0A8J6XY82_9BACT|nr:M2 family metallopeptidase [Candidatus Polarisedimenticola svalbardensis]